MKHVKVEYIGDGAFVGGEDQIGSAKIEFGETCVVLKESTFKKILKIKKEWMHFEAAMQQKEKP